MDFNTIFFGFLIFISLGVFFLLGPLRASAKQRNRVDRIDWSNKKYFLFFKYFLIAMISILIIGFLVRLFV